LPSLSCSTSQSCFQIHIWLSFGNSISFHSLHMSKPGVFYVTLLSLLQWFFINCIFVYWLISSNFVFHCCVLDL
jgi:hypothetical protein